MPKLKPKEESKLKNKHQLKLKAFYSEFIDHKESNKSNLLNILSEHLNLLELIPTEFYHSYYGYYGRNREFTLESIISSLILQKILGYNKISTLIDTLNISFEARQFCGFKRVPNKSQFTRFKKKFHNQLHDFFNHLVLKTEPICRKLGENFASHVIIDTSGILPNVKENNDKYLFSIVKNLKKVHKGKSEKDLYKMAYNKMNKTASANDKIRLMYINGSFNYAYKFSIVTNAHGIVRNISFVDNDFIQKHTEVKDHIFNSSNEQEKSASDSILLKPTLIDFFDIFKDSDYNFHTFLGDSAFDKFDNYPMLINEFKFKRALIPTNPRGTKSSKDADHIYINKDGIPVCSKHKLPFKSEGTCNGKNRSLRRKFVCPNSNRYYKNKRIVCSETCSTSNNGRNIYTYNEQDLRMNPGISRATKHFKKVYKRRVIVERTIDYFKTNMGINNTFHRDSNSIKSDLLLSGITQLISLIIADKLSDLKNFKSLRKLLKVS